MHSISGLVALATTFTSAMAAVQGFNYGSTFTTGAPKHQSDFENEFSAAASLDGAPGDGFHSARLYTTVVSHPPCGITVQRWVATNQLLPTARRDC